MREIAEHLLDIVQNAMLAGAANVSVSIVEHLQQDRLTLRVEDNGCGMDQSLLAEVFDPFVSTRHKRTGLGLPLLEQLAEAANGEAKVASQPGQGTTVEVIVQRSHWDCPPLGNVADSIIASLQDSVDLVFTYYRYDEDGALASTVSLDTREIKEHLQGVPITHPEVLLFIRDLLQLPD